MSISVFVNRRAGVHVASGGISAPPRDHGQPVSARASSTGQGRLPTRQRQRGGGHVSDAHRVFLSHLHFPASVQPTPVRQLLLPHRAGDAELLRRAGRRADGRVRAHRHGGKDSQGD